MPSSVQKKPNIEGSVYDRLDGKQHYIDIYRYLKAAHEPKPSDAIVSAVERSKTRVSTHLNEMERREVVTAERNGGRKKYWDISPDVYAVIDDPDVVETEVQVERTFDSISDFLREHVEMVRFLGGVFLLGGLMEFLEFVPVLPDPFDPLGVMLIVAAVTGLATMLLMALKVVKDPFTINGSGGDE